MHCRRVALGKPAIARHLSWFALDAFRVLRQGASGRILRVSIIPSPGARSSSSRPRPLPAPAPSSASTRPATSAGTSCPARTAATGSGCASSNCAGVLTSESVSAGHPDKNCDRGSDAILDAFLALDPRSRVACETFVADQRVIGAVEFRTADPRHFAAVRAATRRASCAPRYATSATATQTTTSTPRDARWREQCLIGARPYPRIATSRVTFPAQIDRQSAASGIVQIARTTTPGVAGSRAVSPGIIRGTLQLLVR